MWRRLSAVGLGCVMSVLLVEAFLRVTHRPLSLALSNYIVSCYENDVATPVRYTVPELGLRWPRPHVRTRCGFNGYTWQHASDHLGFRNPEDWRRVDVALLGDSMIYGYGVEEHETAAALLRRRLGLRVANLGQVGASPIDYLVQIRNVVPMLRPRVAVVFLYRNDIRDLNRARTRAQIQRFVETGRGPESAPHPAALFHDRGSSRDRTSPLVRFASRLQSFRAARFFWLENVTHAHEDSRGPFLAPRDDALGVAYIRALLLAAHASLEGQGARMVLANMPASTIPGSDGERAEVSVRETTRAIAAELGVPFFDPTRVMRTPDGRVDRAAFLPHDFHLTPEGHRRLARSLAAFLEREGLLGSRAEGDGAAR